MWPCYFYIAAEAFRFGKWRVGPGYSYFDKDTKNKKGKGRLRGHIVSAILANTTGLWQYPHYKLMKPAKFRLTAFRDHAIDTVNRKVSKIYYSSEAISVA